jgi:hypothetical protein
MIREKKTMSHFLAGAIVAAILIFYSVILIISDQIQNQQLAWISYVLMIGSLIYFIREYGHALDFNITFGKLFSYGFKSTTFATIIMLAFQVSLNLIFPEMQEKMIEVAREKMSEDPRVTEEAIEMTTTFLTKTFWPLLIAGTLFGSLVIGAIGSLIGAAITPKNPKTPFEQ